MPTPINATWAAWRAISDKVMDQARKSLPRASTLVLRGQVETMQTSFQRLGFGMLFAILLVYLLMVVNFQSWLDPFIILTAMPGALRRDSLDALC